MDLLGKNIYPTDPAYNLIQKYTLLFQVPHKTHHFLSKLYIQFPIQPLTNASKSHHPFTFYDDGIHLLRFIQNLHRHGS